MDMTVLAPGDRLLGQSAEMIASRQSNAQEMDAYERVLGDAMAGDATLFAREDYGRSMANSRSTAPKGAKQLEAE